MNLIKHKIKKIMKNFLASIFILLLSASSMAQTKVGTIDSDYVLGSLPELDSVQVSIKTYGDELDKQFQGMVANYQEKVKAFQALPDTTKAIDRKAKQDVIVGIEQDLQKFRQNSQQLIQIRQGELMRPLYNKMGMAIEAVAKRKGYTQVLTLGSSVAYFDPNNDLTQAVADELGITLKQ